MSNLFFDREKQNIGGVNEFSFILESSLNAAIEIIKGQATTFDISTDFIVPRLVNGSIKFAESKRNINLFEYSVSARVAQDDYEKLQDAIMFDTNRIIAIVKDNNGHRRLLGQLNNACELTINFDKGTQTADLNHYAIELRWTSKYRAAIVAATYVVPQTMAAEDGTLISYESAIDGNKLSGQEIASTIVGSWLYIILPDNLNPGNFKSYRIAYENLIPAIPDIPGISSLEKASLVDGDNVLGLDSENGYEAIRTTWAQIKTFLGAEIVANKENTTLDTSTTKYPTNRLVKEFVENLVIGLWDDRGNYDASGNVYPSSGGSGTAGAIMKGDIWTISIGGDLSGVPVQQGDTLRALQDTPGQNDEFWAVADTNIGYTPENAINKVPSFQSTPDDTHYPSEKLVKDSLDLKVNKVTPLNEYHYFSSTTGDAVGDTRTSNQSGGQLLETCITAHATRGSGEWLKTEWIINKTLIDSNETEVVGSYLDITGMSTYNAICELICQYTGGNSMIFEKFIIRYQESGDTPFIFTSERLKFYLITGYNQILIKLNSSDTARIVNEMGQTINLYLKLNFLKGSYQQGGD